MTEHKKKDRRIGFGCLLATLILVEAYCFAFYSWQAALWRTARAERLALGCALLLLLTIAFAFGAALRAWRR